MSDRPPVLFVCVRNAGKSRMAAGLMADLVGGAAEVSSAGTAPGTALNELSVRVLGEVGVDISDERPKAVTEEMVRSADVVVTLGRDAHVASVEGTHVERWVTDEPSERGVDGVERMRLVRDDIARRVAALAHELGVPPGGARHPMA
ncbi:low molecular weight phosphatase family protein [Geodermatophilus sp. DSM 44513]|uniref:arsenate-mycothiol transferase ArsC n=1 Tax=Geodermatophilus sp. DSM 44513 TaxID=1528104 RepID=UPI0012804F90|nr:low molecular weight phosphatase family protein [Geodermatophilus sp. DSM 44513]WNV75377.1 low molecular weight phosphatase family protein [Geodermatophilus sp. DSM 44513]